MNFKKKMSAALAAVLCCSMMSAFSISAGAEEYTHSEGASIIAELSASDPTYTEAAKLANLKYNFGLAKKAMSYTEKTPKNGVTFSKSRTKRFLNKYTAALQNVVDNPDKASVSFSAASKDTVASVAVKGSNAKIVVYSSSDEVQMGMAIYVDEKNTTILDLAGKQKMTTPNDAGTSADDTVMSSADSMDLGIKDSAKGKLFKFKYNDKGYYYEVFKNSDGETMGFVFDSKLNLVMMIDSTGASSVKFSTSVKSSEVKVPDGYEEISL